jgi:hypothetical protein
MQPIYRMNDFITREREVRIMIEIKRFKDFDEIKEIWECLYTNNPDSTIYQSVKYNELIWNNFFPYRIILRVIPVFYVFFQDGRPILIIPLTKSISSNKYYIFGNKSGGGYLDFIYDGTLTACDLENCLNKLRNQYNITSIVLNHVRSQTTLGTYSLKNGGKLSDVPCTSIILPDSYDEYYSSLSKNMRQNIRTAYNRLAKDELELKYDFSDYRELPRSQKDELLNIYINRQTTKYKANRRCLFSIFTKYVDIGTKAENSDELEAVFLIRIDGQIAAFFDALYDEETVIVPRLSIVDSFNRYSPGVILLNESIKWVIENTKIRKIDLTHGDEKYKLAMGGTVFQCVEGKL